MEALLSETIASGLKRSAIKTCSSWSESYRMIQVPGKAHNDNWSFYYHPWLKDPHDSKAEEMVVQKAAQMGFTEWALNTTFYAIDILGQSVLYILPSESDASDFSASRFDPALEASPHLASIFSDVQNIGHKRAGSVNLFVRGSRSRSKLKSIPTGRIVEDEVDEMHQQNRALARERASGQMVRVFQSLSTPTIEDYGINLSFKESTQDHYFFKCPHCGHRIELTLDNLIITADSPNDRNLKRSHLICLRCKGVLDHKAKPEMFKTAEYVPAYSDTDVQGWYINQLYSCMLEPYNIARSVLLAKIDPAEEQELYNSKLGLPHAVEGARLTDSIIKKCQFDYQKYEYNPSGRLTTMGVDVGKVLHVVVYEWILSEATGDISTMAKPRVLNEQTVHEFEEIDNLIRNFSVHACVVDANPEKRKALELAMRFPGLVRICYYGNNVSGRTVKLHDESEHSLTVDRTAWLDIMFSRYHNESIGLPSDVSMEFKENMKALVRIYRKDKDGNPVGAYVNAKPDHFAHASNYAEIALAVAMDRASPEDI